MAKITNSGESKMGFIKKMLPALAAAAVVVWASNNTPLRQFIGPKANG